MKKEEIYFLRVVGLNVKDDQEAITTDSVDRFPNISTYVEELKRVTGEDWSTAYPLLKRSVYTSCMMHYTIEVWRKRLISQEIFDHVMNKAERVLRSIGSDRIIALTLLYEGPHYLHPEIYTVYERAGYRSIVRRFTDIFAPLIEQVEREKDFSNVYGGEHEAYIALYDNFMGLEEHIEQ